MNRFKYEAFCREFPFIPAVVGENNDADPTMLNTVRIKRADERLLGWVPEDTGYDCCMGQRWSTQDVSFALADDTLLPCCVKQRGDWQYANRHTCANGREGETILEAISRMDVAERLKYVVVFATSGCDFDDTPTVRVVEIYKTPKTTSYADVIDAAWATAVCDVAAEIRLVDEADAHDITLAGQGK